MEHPIQGLMKTAMESIKGMVDVDTIVGDAVESEDGTVIIPVSRVSLGFVAGGGEYTFNGGNGRGQREGGRDADRHASGHEWPFGGGSGAGVSVSPVGFLIVGDGTVRFLPVDQRATLERVLDVAPELLERLQEVWKGNGRSEAGEKPARTLEPTHRSGFEELDDYDDI